MNKFAVSLRSELHTVVRVPCIAKRAADGASISPGGQVMYTLLVQNHGPTTAISARVSDAIPADRLHELGYRDVRTYVGGIEDWIAAGIPVERPRTVLVPLSELALGPTASLFEGHRRAGVDASMFLTRTPAGRAVELHTHPYAEVFLLLEGRGRWNGGRGGRRARARPAPRRPARHPPRRSQHRRRAATRRLDARARDRAHDPAWRGAGVTGRRWRAGRAGRRGSPVGLRAQVLRPTCCSRSSAPTCARDLVERARPDRPVDPQALPRPADRGRPPHGREGSVAYNDRLSPRRARVVARWLVDHGGLPRSRMTVRGFGERDPVAPNTEPEGSDNPAGRRLNRRVVVGVTAEPLRARPTFAPVNRRWQTIDRNETVERWWN